MNLTRETQEAFQRQQGEMMKTFQQMAQQQQQQQQQNAALLSVLESLLASETEKNCDTTNSYGITWKFSVHFSCLYY